MKIMVHERAFQFLLKDNAASFDELLGGNNAKLFLQKLTYDRNM